jgi:hypothetical protein
VIPIVGQYALSCWIVSEMIYASERPNIVAFVLSVFEGKGWP